MSTTNPHEISSLLQQLPKIQSKLQDEVKRLRQLQKNEEGVFGFKTINQMPAEGLIYHAQSEKHALSVQCASFTAEREKITGGSVVLYWAHKIISQEIEKQWLKFEIDEITQKSKFVKESTSKFLKILPSLSQPLNGFQDKSGRLALELNQAQGENIKFANEALSLEQYKNELQKKVEIFEVARSNLSASAELLQFEANVLLGDAKPFKQLSSDKCQIGFSYMKKLATDEANLRVKLDEAERDLLRIRGMLETAIDAMEQPSRQEEVLSMFRKCRLVVEKWIAPAASVALFFVSQSGLAASPSFNDVANIQGIRPLALGQAFTAVADDQNALYYNPAGLARLEGWSLELISIHGGWNTQTELKTLLALKDDFGATGGDLVKTLEVVKKISGENYHINVGIAPYFVMPKFGIGLYMNNSVDVRGHNPRDVFLDLDLLTDIDLRAGYADSFFGNKLSVGLTAGPRVRMRVAGEIGLDQIDILTEKSGGKETQEKLMKEFMSGGVGIGVDAGLLFTPVDMWKPTLGLSINNIGDLRFMKLSSVDKLGGEVSSNIPQTVNVGAAITPEFDVGMLGNVFVRTSIDFRDINLPTMASKKPSLGMEAGWNKLASVQLGLSEGYVSGGFELRIFLLNLRFATYKTDRGFFPSQNADRRYVAGFKLFI